MNRPVLLVLYGLPGAGKSRLADALHDALGWPVVNRDVVRAAMFPQCRWTDVEKRAATEAVFLAVSTHAALSQSCVVDGMTFSRSAERERLAEIAACYACLHVPVFLECSAELAASRIAAQQSHPARDRSPELAQAIAERFEPVAHDVLRVCAESGTQAQLTQVLGRTRALAGEDVLQSVQC